LIVDLILKKEYELKNILLAFTSWTSIGNSNWYITAILVMYVIVTISFLVFRKHHFPALVLMTVITVAYVYFNMKIGRSAYCYNTVIVFPLGMWYAYLQPTIDKIVMKNNINYFFTMSVVAIAFIFAYKHRTKSIECYAIWACAFAVLVALLAMKIKINNPILIFFGEHVFSIYILQRLPMIILKSMGMASKPINFFIASLTITIVIALIYDKLIAKLDYALFDKRKLKKAKEAEIKSEA
jgi:hypothetical protein